MCSSDLNKSRRKIVICIVCLPRPACGGEGRGEGKLFSKISTVLASLAGLVAAVVYFLPPPAGVAPVVMHAAALMLLTVGLWATAVVPEYVASLLFFLLAVVLSIASPQVVFSCFSSATMWLVLGGLIIAEAVGATGLGRRFASVLFERYVKSYGALMIAVAVARFWAGAGLIDASIDATPCGAVIWTRSPVSEGNSGIRAIAVPSRSILLVETGRTTEDAANLRHGVRGIDQAFLALGVLTTHSSRLGSQFSLPCRFGGVRHGLNLVECIRGLEPCPEHQYRRIRSCAARGCSLGDEARLLEVCLVRDLGDRLRSRGDLLLGIDVHLVGFEPGDPCLVLETGDLHRVVGFSGRGTHA